MLELLFDSAIWANYTYCLIFIALFLLRIIYTYIVFVNAKRRNIDTPVYWAVVTLLCGLIAFVLYFAINFGVGEKTKPKKSQIAVFTVAFALVICMIGAAYPVSVAEAVAYYRDDMGMVVDKKGFLEYVTYDKMGKEYNIYRLSRGEEEVALYSKDGKTLNNVDCLIDKDGYAIRRFDIADLEERFYDGNDDYYYLYFDKKGNAYYESYYCSWDKDGNLVFTDQMIEGLNYNNTESVEEEW